MLLMPCIIQIHVNMYVPSIKVHTHIQGITIIIIIIIIVREFACRVIVCSDYLIRDIVMCL